MSGSGSIHDDKTSPPCGQQQVHSFKDPTLHFTEACCKNLYEESHSHEYAIKLNIMELFLKKNCTSVAIRKRSRVPGVMITQYVEELPPGCTTPDFIRKPIALTIQEGNCFLHFLPWSIWIDSRI